MVGYEGGTDVRREVEIALDMGLSVSMLLVVCRELE